MIINLLNLIDSKKCFEMIRLMRWGETVTCPKCGSAHVIKQGFDEVSARPPTLSMQELSISLRWPERHNLGWTPSAFGGLDDLSLLDEFEESLITKSPKNSLWITMTHSKYRGISPEKLPLDLGFFEFVHNVQKRGKALWPYLLECLLA